MSIDRPKSSLGESVLWPNPESGAYDVRRYKKGEHPDDGDIALEYLIQTPQGTKKYTHYWGEGGGVLPTSIETPLEGVEDGQEGTSEDGEIQRLEARRNALREKAVRLREAAKGPSRSEGEIENEDGNVNDDEVVSIDREVNGLGYGVNHAGEAVVYREPSETGEDSVPYIVRDGGVHRWTEEDGTQHVKKWDAAKGAWEEFISEKDDKTGELLKEARHNTEDDVDVRAGKGRLEKNPIVGEAALNKWGDAFVKKILKEKKDEPEDIKNLRNEITKTKLEQELAALKAPKATPEVPSPEADKDPLAKWEFSEDTKFSERIERRNAALKARKYEHFSEGRQLNSAKIFYETAERWKKFPLWGKIGISLGILGAGVAGAAFSPLLAGAAGLTALAWRGIATVGSGAVMGTSMYTYLKKRNSRHPVLGATLAALGMGAAVGVAGKYLAEYVNSYFNPEPLTAPELTWKGGETLMAGTGAVPIEKGVEGVLETYLTGSGGLLEPYHFSAEAQSEFLDAMHKSLTDSGGYAPELLGRDNVALDAAGHIALKTGDVLHMKVLGSDDFTQLLESYISEDGTPHLWKALESQGGTAELLTRLREAFNK